MGNKPIDTAHMRYSLGMALWLSYKPLETFQAMGEFGAAIMFLKQRDPTHHSLTTFKKALDLAQDSLKLLKEPGMRTAWPFWRPPTSRLEDRRETTDLFRELCALSGLEREAKIIARVMQQGLRRHGLHEFRVALAPYQNLLISTHSQNWNATNSRE